MLRTTVTLKNNRVSPMANLLLVPSSSSMKLGTSRSRGHGGGRGLVINARDRSKNRRPLQKGRNLSIEAIQTVQSLKRATNTQQIEALLDSKLRRLLKFDMVAVLRELLRQNQCQLSLLVFEDVRKEYWYKPQASLYAEMITVLGNNGKFEEVLLIFSLMKTETSLKAKTQDLNTLLESLISFNMSGLAIECFYLMESLGCEPDRSTFRILVKYLESNGETTTLSASIRLEAQKYYGECLDFLEEQEELTIS